MKEILIAHEPSYSNLSDLMTPEALPGGERRERLDREEVSYETSVVVVPHTSYYARCELPPSSTRRREISTRGHHEMGSSHKS